MNNLNLLIEYTFYKIEFSFIMRKQPLPAEPPAARLRSTSNTSKHSGKSEEHQTSQPGGLVAVNRRQERGAPEKFYCIFPGNGYNIIKSVLSKRTGWTEIRKEDVWSNVNQNRINFIWKPTNFSYQMFCNIDNVLQKSHALFRDSKLLCRELIVNHLENHRELTTKTGLIRCLKYYYKDNVDFIENGYTVFDTTPTSFVVSSKLETLEAHQFNKRFDDLDKEGFHPLKEKMPEEQCKHNTWLVKPANENQGKGIKIFSDKEQINRFLEQSIKFSYWVIQKYIERPLLYKGRKFDIRVWAFAQSNLDFYFYDIGYLRTSSEGYNMDDMNNELTHLTNNCLQIKNKESYGQHEEGNVISFGQFQEYLDQEHSQHNLDFQRDFLRRMKDIAIDCYLSAKSILNPCKRRNTFELFGFDFMIDETFRVWLLEVNTNPYIGIHNKSMKHIVPAMFEDLFKIVIDPVYVPSVSQQDIDAIGTDTQFELLYSRMRGVNKRRHPLDGIYPIKELDRRKNYSKRATQRKKEATSSRKVNQNANGIDSQVNIGENKSQVKSETNEENWRTEDGHSSDCQQEGQASHTVERSSRVVGNSSRKKQGNENRIQARSSSKQVDQFGEPIPGYSVHRRAQADNQKQAGGEQPWKQPPPKIAELKKSKLISEHVKNLDKNSPFYKQHIQEALNRIVATMKSWELFSYVELDDANQALRMLLDVLNAHLEETMLLLASLTGLVGSNEVPILFRTQISANILLMLKNKGFVKYFLHDQDAFTAILPLYQALMEESLNEAHSASLEELQTTCS